MYNLQLHGFSYTLCLLAVNGVTESFDLLSLINATCD